MSEIFEYDVFLSFASSDEKIAKPLWQEMCLNRLRVFWSDATLKDKLGESWFEVIQSSLENSQNFVLLCSPSAMLSEWVKREYVAFYSHCYRAGVRRLIPLLVGDYKISDLPLFLRNLEACRLNDEHSIKKVIRILGGIDVDEIRVALTNKIEENDLLKNDLRIANSKIGFFQQEVSKVSSEISNLKNENSLLKQKLGAADYRIVSLQKTLNTVSNENAKLKDVDKTYSKLEKPENRELKVESQLVGTTSKNKAAPTYNPGAARDDQPSTNLGEYSKAKNFVVDKVDASMKKSADTEESLNITRAEFKAQPSGPHPSIAQLIDEKSRRDFIKKIFQKDIDAYSAFIEDLEATQTWKEARVLLDGAFKQRKVNPYSKGAVQLSDVVFSRYFTRGAK